MGPFHTRTRVVNSGVRGVNSGVRGVHSGNRGVNFRRQRGAFRCTRLTTLKDFPLRAAFRLPARAILAVETTAPGALPRAAFRGSFEQRSRLEPRAQRHASRRTRRARHLTAETRAQRLLGRLAFQARFERRLLRLQLVHACATTSDFRRQRGEFRHQRGEFSYSDDFLDFNASTPARWAQISGVRGVNSVISDGFFDFNSSTPARRPQISGVRGVNSGVGGANRRRRGEFRRWRGEFRRWRGEFRRWKGEFRRRRGEFRRRRGSLVEQTRRKWASIVGLNNDYRPRIEVYIGWSEEDDLGPQV
eukprot:1183429-Prorocentrum_minimum.AAC.1